MPNKKWTPPLSKLACVEPCVRDFLGDTFCDCNNNNKHCSFDGGDCCRKTINGRAVRYASQQICKCIDPVALLKLQVEKRLLENNESGDGSGYSLQSDNDGVDDDF